MARARLPSGDLEDSVLAAVSSLGQATGREVFVRIGEPKGLAYTTIAKVLDRLHDKGLLTRHQEQRKHVYKAVMAPRLLDRARIADVLDRLLGGEAEPIVASLVDAVEAHDPALLDRLAAEIARRRSSRRGS